MNHSKGTIAAVLLLALAGCAVSLHDVVGRGDAARVEAILSERPEAVHDRNELGKTPLHYAVTFHRPELLARLAEAGADLDAQDNTGMTPLHVAAMLGRAEEAAWLMEQGADLELEDSFGDRPVHTAALFGQGLVLKRLLDAGASIDPVNHEGKTPLDLSREQDDARIPAYLEKRLAARGR